MPSQRANAQGRLWTGTTIFYPEGVPDSTPDPPKENVARRGVPVMPDRSAVDTSIPYCGDDPPPQPLDEPGAMFIKVSGYWCRLDSIGRRRKCNALGDYYTPPVAGKRIDTSSTKPDGMSVAEWKTFTPAQKRQHWKTIMEERRLAKSESLLPSASSGACTLEPSGHLGAATDASATCTLKPPGHLGAVAGVAILA